MLTWDQKFKEWCHMWSDAGDEELDKFALSIGLQLKLKQVKNKKFHHYDLSPWFRSRALSHGAEYIRLTDYLEKSKHED
jgi:ABC-type Fe3+-hydroxamate transport system substrate-binding protein